MAETNQLLKTIQETKSDGLNTLMESLDNLTFSQYLNHILEIKHVTKAQVLSKTTIQRNYGYQIFDGSKVPNKDKVIQLSLRLDLDLRMTNNLLSLSNNGMLYPKVKRDALLIYCIENKKSVYETNECLMEYKLELLINDEKIITFLLTTESQTPIMPIKLLGIISGGTDYETML